MISIDDVKALRERTGISVMQCRKALDEAGGDMEKAVVILQRKSKEVADKKSDRTIGAGTVGSYIHAGGSIGAMVELVCETDFVSRNDEFMALADDIAMHVAAMSPSYLTMEDIREDEMERVKGIMQEEVKKESDKPAEIQDKMLEGKIKSYFKERVLLEQPFVKENEKTVSQIIKEAVQKFGENIRIARISRLAIGE
ncbi:MAG: elongation factor Ts [bacterium]|nr:elongation factor Ts [bacterium]